MTTESTKWRYDRIRNEQHKKMERIKLPPGVLQGRSTSQGALFSSTKWNPREIFWSNTFFFFNIIEIFSLIQQAIAVALCKPRTLRQFPSVCPTDKYSLQSCQYCGCDGSHVYKTGGGISDASLFCYSPSSSSSFSFLLAPSFSSCALALALLFLFFFLLLFLSVLLIILFFAFLFPPSLLFQR